MGVKLLNKLMKKNIQEYVINTKARRISRDLTKKRTTKIVLMMRKTNIKKPWKKLMVHKSIIISIIALHTIIHRYTNYNVHLWWRHLSTERRN